MPALTIYRIERTDADRLLFLFHGYSAEQHHLAAYVPLVDPGERFSAVCPRAVHDLPEGDGASWWERGADGPVPASFLAALDTVEDLIDRETTAAGIGRDRCVIGGFSQGGALSLALATRQGAPLRRAVGHVLRPARCGRAHPGPVARSGHPGPDPVRHG